MAIDSWKRFIGSVITVKTELNTEHQCMLLRVGEDELYSVYIYPHSLLGYTCWHKPEEISGAVITFEEWARDILRKYGLEVGERYAKVAVLAAQEAVGIKGDPKRTAKDDVADLWVTLSKRGIPHKKDETPKEEAKEEPKPKPMSTKLKEMVKAYFANGTGPEGEVLVVVHYKPDEFPYATGVCRVRREDGREHAVFSVDLDVIPYVSDEPKEEKKPAPSHGVGHPMNRWFI